MFETVEDEAQRVDLLAALEKLTPRQRQAVELFAQGYTQEEIGQALGIKQPSVLRLIRRAAAKMRRLCA